MSGKVLAIARRAATRAPMELLEEVAVSVQTGVAGDARGALKGRQVTVLCKESWDAACVELGQELPWTIRRANILVDGLDLANSVGKSIRIRDLTLAITDETDPCQRMEEQVTGLRQALTPDWRGGVTCVVTSDGGISVGDSVELTA